MENTRYRSPEKLAAFRALLNVERKSPTGRAWDSHMDRRERRFWLHAAKCNPTAVTSAWFDLSPEVRGKLEVVMLEVAERAVAIRNTVPS